MITSGTELINLESGVNYAPTFVSTDKRAGRTGSTTVGYWQVGEDQQYGYARGPVFKIEFADLSGISTATHVKIWGIDNKDDDAPIYPITYFTSLTSPALVEVYLKKFEFCNLGGTLVPETDYLVVGYKKRVLPLAW
jgi:hypothetical protein